MFLLGPVVTVTKVTSAVTLHSEVPVKLHPTPSAPASQKPSSLASPRVAGRRLSPGVMRVEELVLPITSFNTQESGQATQLGSTVELALNGAGVAGEPAQRA